MPGGLGSIFRQFALPCVLGEGGRLLELGFRFGVASQLVKEIASHAVEQVIALECAGFDDLIDKAETRLRA